MKITISYCNNSRHPRNLGWCVSYCFRGARVRKYFKTMGEAKEYAKCVSHALFTGCRPAECQAEFRLSDFLLKRSPFNTVSK